MVYMDISWSNGGAIEVLVFGDDVGGGLQEFLRSGRCDIGAV